MAASEPITTRADACRRLRLDAGYRSQKSYADALGVGRSTVSRWEKGEILPDIALYERMLELAGRKMHIVHPTLTLVPRS